MEVLGEMSPRLEPGVHPEVLAIGLEAISDVVHGVGDLLADGLAFDHVRLLQLELASRSGQRIS
jgi:hypothetical protein